MCIILGGLGRPRFPNYFLIISYSISYSYYLFIFPKVLLLPIHFCLKKENIFQFALLVVAIAGPIVVIFVSER